jgi:hypothetical protein
MELKEIKANLGKVVRMTDNHNYIDGLFRLTALTLRRNDSGFYYQAEVQKLFDDKSVMTVRPDMIQEIK